MGSRRVRECSGAIWSWLWADSSSPRIMSFLATGIVIFGGGKATWDYMIPEASITLVVADSTFSPLDSMNFVAVNHGNATGVIDRTVHFVAKKTYPPLQFSPESGRSSSLVLAPGEGGEFVINNAAVGDFHEGEMAHCEMRYRVRQPPAVDWTEHTLTFRCGRAPDIPWR